MVRKPFPKDAALRVREYLASQGIELTQRKALEVVARVEGYNDWHAMFDATRAQAAQRAADTKRELPSEYERWWQSLQPLIVHQMSGLCHVLRGWCKPQYRVIDPGVEHDDDSHVSFRIERKSVPGFVMLALKLALREDETHAGMYALRLGVEDESGDEVLSWTSGPLYTPQLWTNDLEELKGALQDGFRAGDILLSLLKTPSAKLFRPTTVPVDKLLKQHEQP